MILVKKDTKQSSSGKTSGILHKEESRISTKVEVSPPPLPTKMAPPPPLPPLPPRQTSESETKHKIPVLVTIKPLIPPVSPLPVTLDMTVTSGPGPATDELNPISVDTEVNPECTATLCDNCVGSILFRMMSHKKN